MRAKLGATNALYPLVTAILFVGEIVGTYADLSVPTSGVVDIARLKPLLFDMASKKYWSLGEPVAA